MMLCSWKTGIPAHEALPPVEAVSLIPRYQVVLAQAAAGSRFQEELDAFRISLLDQLLQQASAFTSTTELGGHIDSSDQQPFIVAAGVKYGNRSTAEPFADANTAI